LAVVGLEVVVGWGLEVGITCSLDLEVRVGSVEAV